MDKENAHGGAFVGAVEHAAQQPQPSSNHFCIVGAEE
jgi:hypothetical protein